MLAQQQSLTAINVTGNVLPILSKNAPHDTPAPKICDARIKLSINTAYAHQAAHLPCYSSPRTKGQLPVLTAD